MMLNVKLNQTVYLDFVLLPCPVELVRGLG
jgi:hypothetical protein